jgi:hypothetical protein
LKRGAWSFEGNRKTRPRSTLLRLWWHNDELQRRTAETYADDGVSSRSGKEVRENDRELGRRLTTSREKVGEDGDDGGARRRSSACTAAHQVRLGGGGVLEQLRLRFSEEEEGATAASSPRSAQRTAANSNGRDGDFRPVFFGLRTN